MLFICPVALTVFIKKGGKKGIFMLKIRLTAYVNKGSETYVSFTIVRLGFATVKLPSLILSISLFSSTKQRQA